MNDVPEHLDHVRSGTVSEGVAGIVWRLAKASSVAVAAACGGQGDRLLGTLAMDSLDAWGVAASLMDGEAAHLCHRPASSSENFLELVCEAEQVLAGRPIEQWPRGTHFLVVKVCDLIGAVRLADSKGLPSVGALLCPDGHAVRGRGTHGA